MNMCFVNSVVAYVHTNTTHKTKIGFVALAERPPDRATTELVHLSPLFLPLLVIVPLLYFIRPSRRHEGSILRPPPSPWALPVIGHLHHVAGALPHRTMRDLSRHYGPLMLLRLCELRVVVASSADAAREIMKTQDLAFASRPVSPSGKVFLGHSSGLVFVPYGEAWRQLHRICTLELFTSRRVRPFGPVREEEVGRLLRSLAQSSSSQVNLGELISAYVADSSVRAVIGSRFKNRGAFLRILERRIKIALAQCLPDLFPSSRLALLVSRMPRQLKWERREIMEFIDTIVQEHQESSRADTGGDDEDFLHLLLRIQKEGKLDPPLTDDDIKTVIIAVAGGIAQVHALPDRRSPGSCMVVQGAATVVRAYGLTSHVYAWLDGAHGMHVQYDRNSMLPLPWVPPRHHRPPFDGGMNFSPLCMAGRASYLAAKSHCRLFLFPPG